MESPEVSKKADAAPKKIQNILSTKHSKTEKSQITGKSRFCTLKFFFEKMLVRVRQGALFLCGGRLSDWHYRSKIEIRAIANN